VSAVPQNTLPEIRLTAGSTIADRFRVEALGSRDVAGDLYKGSDTKNNKPVLLRIFAPELLGDEASREALRERVKQASRVASPNLAAVYGMGKHDQTLYLAGELVEGLSLADHVDKRRQSNTFFPLQGLQKAFLPIVTAVAAAHAQNIFHGTIAARWVQVTEQGRVVLRGLGFLWHLVEQNSFAQALSQTGQPIAPELQDKSPQVTAETDVWGLGALLYELLTNQSAQQGQLSLPSKLRPELPAEFDQVVRRCLATQPSARFPNAEALQKALEPIFAPKQAKPAVAALPGLKAPQRNQEDEERWLVQKQGLDYGPYTGRQVKKQVEDGEINEHTTILDCDNSSRKPIGDHQFFQAFIDDWRKNVSKREALHASASLEKSMKHAGKKSFGLAFGIVAALALGALGYFYLIPKVRDQDTEYPLLLAQVIPGLSEEYNWDVKPERVPIPKMRKRPTGSGSGNNGGNNGSGSNNGGANGSGVDEGYDDSNSMNLDFEDNSEGNSGPSEKSALSLADINKGMKSVLGPLGACAKAEQRRSGTSNFKIDFIITSSGKIRGIRIVAPAGFSGSPTEKCAKSAASRARFPSTPSETSASYSFGI
jgi:eukaryotic-like serine/threonine-protein kinase